MDLGDLNDAAILDAERPRAGPPGGTVSGDRCYATMLLDAELRRSLIALIGEDDLGWVHGCILENGHRDNHLAQPQGARALNCWVQWHDGGQAHISTTGRDTGATVEPPDSEAPAPSAITANHARAATAPQPQPPTSGSQAEALWAIAAALQHLADVVAAALGAGNDDTGRHGIGRTTGS
jgi:hypothetical protein